LTGTFVFGYLYRLMSDIVPDNERQRRLIDVSGVGTCLLPDEFIAFTGEIRSVIAMRADAAPYLFLDELASDKAIVLSGDYSRVDAVMRYCQRYSGRLVSDEEFGHIEERKARNSTYAAQRKRRLYRLLLAARGTGLLNVENAPDLTGFQDWFEKPVGDVPFLIPARRFQRILTDMRRARDGVRIEALGDRITILPHVYVPSDQSVPAMYAAYAGAMKGKTVLDMGTGTGVLALMAARSGASRVVATDSNPNAVENARINAALLGLANVVETRGPGNLFETVAGERFDVILFNAPWIEGEPKTLYDTANYDPGYRVIDAFMRGSGEHLSDGGVILLQYSNISERAGGGSVTRLRQTINDNGFRICETGEITRKSRVTGTWERVYLYELHKDGHCGMV